MRYWLSFDLGLRGEYEQLFGWLDRHAAKECGNNVATFLSDKPREEIARELSLIINRKAKPRIYIINRADGVKWIVGRRTLAPWTGFGQVLSDDQGERDE